MIALKVTAVKLRKVKYYFYLQLLIASEIFDNENQSKKITNLLNRSFFIKSPLRTLNSPLISNPTHINDIFRDLDKFEFNIFDFNRNYGRENLMSLVTFYILEKNNLTKYLSMSKFENFISKTRKKYMDNPYHNVKIKSFNNL